ncbi:MAG: phosphoribosylglycinamide formyltransferase, partial [Deltaproteobacteria bacterium]|nr:phosphoribosylglycinamide formyltransferase [Deltaproteobacteria bacterium]
HGFEAAVTEALEHWDATALVLAGFMRILTAEFIARFPLRIVNTHPALCPAFPGVRAPQQAIDAGVKVSGCTVHFVDAGVDTGPIIFQAAVEVLDDDDDHSLHRRIQVHEHQLLPRAVQLLAAGRLRVDGRRVRITWS